MKQIMKITLLITSLLIITGYSCSKNKEEVVSKEYITVKFGETIAVSNGNEAMKISFTEVKDGRCRSAAAHLCYPNLAWVEISLTQSEQTANITLVISGSRIETDSSFCACEYENGFQYYCVDILGYRIDLIELFPHPDDLFPNKNKEDYIAKFKITAL